MSDKPSSAQFPYVPPEEPEFCEHCCAMSMDCDALQEQRDGWKSEALKLEAALEVFEKEFWHSENCIEWPSGATRYGECTCGYSTILRTLAEFKKWRGGE